MNDLLEGPASHPLQRAFIHSLTSRLNEITSCWQHVLDNPGSKAPQMHFMSAVHYLAGSAGVYGFMAMSRRSYDIIGHMKPCIEQRSAFTKDTQYTIHQLVESLTSLHTYYQKNGFIPPHSPAEQLKDLRPANLDRMPNTAIFRVEHDADEDKKLHGILDPTPWHLTTFKTLGTLLEALQEQLPYAVLLDLQHSMHDGAILDFVTLVQQHPETYPIIFQSATTDFTSRLQATRMGGTHFLPKPIDSYRLIDLLHQASSVRSEEAFKVLLVDDDPETAQYIALFLRKEHIDVHIINNPTQAIDAIARFQPDLVITDLYMPECSGMELAQIIRQHELYFDMPLVFLSSETDYQKHLAALELGSDDFFLKSMNIDLVARAIKSRLSRMATYGIVKKAIMWSPN